MKKTLAALLFSVMAVSIFSVFSAQPVNAEGIDNVYIIPNTEKVLLKQEMEPNGVDTLTAALARNEQEGMQFILAFDQDVTDVKVTVSDLTSESGAKLDYTLYRQHYIYLAPQRFPAEEGSYPDALVPMFDGSDGKPANDVCDIDAGENQGYWITVDSATDQEAGVYTGTVTVSYNEGEDITIPVSVEVWDFDIPVKSTMATMFLADWDNDYYADQGISNQEMNLMIWEFFLDYRISSGYAGFIPYNSYGSDIENYVNALKEFVDTHPEVTALRIPLHGYNASGFDVDEMVNNVNNINMYNALKNAGLLDMCYYYVIDEPADTDANLELIQDLGTAISQFAPEIKNIVTTEREKYAGYISCWCPNWELIDEEGIRNYQAAGDEVWWYGCALPSAPYPTYHTNDNLLSPRVVHWMQKDAGAEGELYWATTLFSYYQGGGNYVSRNPWASAETSEGLAGDGYLCFPGKEGDGIVDRNMLVPTIRLEAIRDGLEDYEYLTLMETNLNTLIETYNLDITTDALLDTYYDALYKEINDYNHDDTTLQQMRQILAEDIMNFNGTEFVAVSEGENGYRDITVYAPSGADVTVDGQAMTEEAKDGYSEYTASIFTGCEQKQVTVKVNDNEYTRILGAYNYGHSISEVSAKDADCINAGNIAYCQCASCGQMFSDAEGTQVISDPQSVIIPATGEHVDADEDGKCDVCGTDVGTEDPDDPQNPPTGEPSDPTDDDKPQNPDNPDPEAPGTNDAPYVWIIAVVCAVCICGIVVLVVLRARAAKKDSKQK